MADPISTQPVQPQEQQSVQPEKIVPVPTDQQNISQPQVEEDEKFFAAIGYFAFLFVVPLIVKPKSQYCKFHATQSIVLFVITIFVLVVLASIPWFGSLLTMALFAVYILAIYRAYKGDYWKIPFVSKFAAKVDLNALYGKAGLAVSSISGLKEKAGSMADKATGAIQNLGSQEPETKQPEQTDQSGQSAPQSPAK